MIRVIIFLLVIIFIIPVAYTRLTRPEQAHFDHIMLDDTTYRDVTFRDEVQHLGLAGMLFVPAGEGPFPGVVVIQGSGESRRENGWYLTLAEYLQRNGIVVLLPDKRGSEKSGGDWRTASFQDLASDVLAALRYLKDSAHAPVSRIGVIGMSQGGHIAPVVAAWSENAAFVVNVVGAAVPMHEQLLYEETNNLEQMGIVPGLSDIIAYPSAWSIRELRQPQFWEAIGNFDPLPYWQRVTVPALILYGEKDTNVPTERSAALLRGLDKPNLEVRIYEGSGHALETPMGDNPRIFREDALEDIRDFIFASETTDT